MSKNHDQTNHEIDVLFVVKKGSTKTYTFSFNDYKNANEFMTAVKDKANELQATYYFSGSNFIFGKYYFLNLVDDDIVSPKIWDYLAIPESDLYILHNYISGFENELDDHFLDMPAQEQVGYAKARFFGIFSNHADFTLYFLTTYQKLEQVPKFYRNFLNFNEIWNKELCYITREVGDFYFTNNNVPVSAITSI